MTRTDDLIRSLGADLRPVDRLWPPFVRALLCILLATVIIALLTRIRGVRTDIAIRLQDPEYRTQVIGAWLTGALATLAAFNVSLPDRSRLWALAPAPAVFLWITGLAWGCLGHWIAVPFGAPVTRDSISCLETICMASAVLGLVMWIMLRRSRPLRPAGTAWLGGIAVAGFADTAHLLIHVVQASLLVLVINIVPASLVAAALARVGRRYLRPA